MSHAHLAYSCLKFKPWMEDNLNDFHGSIGHVRNDISTDFSNLSHVVNHGVELVDELVQVLADATPKSSPQGSILEVLLGTLMNKTPMVEDYGSTQNQGREVQDNDSPPTIETENELD